MMATAFRKFDCKGYQEDRPIDWDAPPTNRQLLACHELDIPPMPTLGLMARAINLAFNLKRRREHHSAS